MVGFGLHLVDVFGLGLLTVVIIPFRENTGSKCCLPSVVSNVISKRINCSSYATCGPCVML